MEWTPTSINKRVKEEGHSNKFSNQEHSITSIDKEMKPFSPLLFLFLVSPLAILGRIDLGPAISQQQRQLGGDGFPVTGFGDTCIDHDGQRRQNGEEWTVRQHFVLLCHQVPSSADGWPIMRVEVVACLRDDGQTRMAIGSEVEESPGRTLLCRRASDQQGPTGEVRREWRAQGGTLLGSSSISASTGPVRTESFSGVFARPQPQFGNDDLGGNVAQQGQGQQQGQGGCFGRTIGVPWQRRSFELECTSPYELPKLVACLPPELNGQRIPAGGTTQVGPFTISCEQSADGSYRYRYQ